MQISTLFYFDLNLFDSDQAYMFYINILHETGIPQLDLWVSVQLNVVLV